jgi:hypothetical protein
MDGGALAPPFTANYSPGTYDITAMITQNARKEQPKDAVVVKFIVTNAASS